MSGVGSKTVENEIACLGGSPSERQHIHFESQMHRHKRPPRLQPLHHLPGNFLRLRNESQRPKIDATPQPLPLRPHLLRQAVGEGGEVDHPQLPEDGEGGGEVPVGGGLAGRVQLEGGWGGWGRNRWFW